MLFLLGCPEAPKPAETGESGGTDTGPGEDTSDGPVDEVCNGVDDDGDGEVDEGLLLHVDADGDGFGDPEVLACEGVADGTDCDDADPDTHPGAPEWCDGVSTSCVGSDEGLVTWEAGEERVDWTAVWSAGTAAAPATVTAPGEGVVHVCEGTWYVALTSESSLTLAGHGAVVLDGAGLVTPVTVRGSLAASGVEVTGGVGEDGGGLHVEGATLSLQGVTLSANQATRYGGGVYAAVDLLDARDVLLAGNQAARGGGAWLTTFQSGGAPERRWNWDNADFETNQADLFGAVGALAEGTTLLTFGAGAATGNAGYQGGGFLGVQCGAGAACEVELGAGLVLEGSDTSGVGGDVYAEALGAASLELRFLGESTNAAAAAGAVAGVFADHAGEVSVELGGLVSAAVAGDNGGALLLEGGNTSFSVWLTGEVRAGQAGGDGAVLAVSEAAVWCDGATLHANRSARSSGAVYLRDGTLHATDCNLGEGADENFGGDAPSDLMGLTYGEGTTVDVTCTRGACAP